jgi:4-amino-4-deoxy-L-arabinose transferase-like glycosyltransferase
MHSNKVWVYVLLLLVYLIFIFPSFFYKLGASSLVSFDEAWYATIAHNINITHDPLNLYFNNSRFADHPPAGFWFLAASQAILGNNEFGSRAAAAILGLATLVLVFILGTQISSPAAGLASAIALSSSPWFLYRARSGNLDITLTFFFVLTFILAISASKNKKYLIPFGLSLAFLFLTKTMVPFTILPALAIIFWNSPVLRTREFIYSLTLTLTLTLSWLISQLINYHGFIAKYFTIGLPTSKSTSILSNILLTKTYIHEGIGVWFRPAIIFFPLALILKNKYLFSLFIFILVFLIPFTFSSRGQIWHLIPIQPFLLLILFSTLFLLLKKFLKRPALAASLTLTLTLTITSPQISKNWHDFVDIPAYISDEAILSRKAASYPYPLSIDDRFLPIAVFYSQKQVNDLPTPDINSYFNNSNPSLLITHQWRLDQFPLLKTRYQILNKDRDMLLILITPLLN